MNFTGLDTQRIIYYKDQRLPKDFLPSEIYIIRALKYRQLKDMNTFVLIVGNPRTSKSSFALKLCERLNQLKNTEFDVEKQLTFDDIRKFLEWSKNAEGSEFILDETGTTLSPEQFWQLQQRVMRRFIQTQGFRRNILFWVLPSIIFIQKGFRFMSNYGVKTVNQGYVSIYKINVDQLLGKGFFEWIGNTKFSKPSDSVWDKYMELKKEWNDQNLQSDIDYLDTINKPDDWQLMKQKNLALTIQLKERQLSKYEERINDPFIPQVPQEIVPQET